MSGLHIIIVNLYENKAARQPRLYKRVLYVLYFYLLNDCSYYIIAKTRI